MLINNSYFVAERDVPNTNYLDASSLLDNIINVREKEYLIDALGYELFVKFMTALKAETDEQRMLDLLFGADFIGFNGRPTRWEGFVKVLEDTADPLEITIDGEEVEVPITGVPIADELTSPICDYVYFYWLRKKRTNTGDIGEVKAEGQNSFVVSARRKGVEAWNTMVTRTKKLQEFMQVNSSVYPEFQGHNGSQEHRLLLTTLNPFW